MVSCTNPIETMKPNTLENPMKDTKKRVRITITCTEEERMYIKMLAAKQGVTISEFILSCIRPLFPV
jgi:uncharacterized protein (DUF1778 family)